MSTHILNKQRDEWLTGKYLENTLPFSIFAQVLLGKKYAFKLAIQITPSVEVSWLEIEKSCHRTVSYNCYKYGLSVVLLILYIGKPSTQAVFSRILKLNDDEERMSSRMKLD